MNVKEINETMAALRDAVNKAGEYEFLEHSQFDNRMVLGIHLKRALDGKDYVVEISHVEIIDNGLEQLESIVRDRIRKQEVQDQ